MEIFILYTTSLIAILIGTAAIYMALIEWFPATWLYYHYFIRKPINWTILIGISSWIKLSYYQTGIFPYEAIIPLLISIFALVLTYKMHQEKAFPAVSFPKITDDVDKLPLKDDMEFAVIEYNGITKSYPLDYVIHHHIINDDFNNKTVALTYCAMCRSIIPFDVTDIGLLFVASFKNANMIVADKKTKTFFQQATFKSIIGRLHPFELTMISFQILSWAEIKKTIENPMVVEISNKDLRQFELPIPGIWKKIIESESTPGISSKNRDKTFPSRTHVIGIIDNSIEIKPVYLKSEVLSKKMVENKELGFVLIAVNETVNAFKNSLKTNKLNIQIVDGILSDSITNTKWNIRGKYISGELKEDLESIAISDEYWFSWIKFHNTSKIIRL